MNYDIVLIAIAIAIIMGTIIASAIEYDVYRTVIRERKKEAGE